MREQKLKVPRSFGSRKVSKGSNAPTTSFKMIKAPSDRVKKGTIWTLLLIALLAPSFVVAQYDSYQQHGGGGGYDYGMEERPKLNLGIRLRIPAFRFELPRFSLPKITVSAKIRQPDKPRVINLPEINLDTTSKVEPPGSKMAGGGGGGSGGGSYGSGSYGGEYKMSSSDYQQPMMSYGRHAQEERSQTFTFSSGEDSSPAYGNGKGNNYNNNNDYHANANHQGSQMAARPSPVHYVNHAQTGQYGMRTGTQQGGGYHAATMSRPTYSTFNQPQGGGYQEQAAQGTASTVTGLEAETVVNKNPDYGFSAPVHVNPELSAREPSASRGRRRQANE